MTDFSNPQKQDKLQSYLNIHLKKDELSLSLSNQIDALHKKKRKKWILLAVNTAAVLFFGYSFYFGITNLGKTFFYIILAVFLINVGLIYYQKNQIDDLVEYLHWKERQER